MTQGQAEEHESAVDAKGGDTPSAPVTGMAWIPSAESCPRQPMKARRLKRLKAWFSAPPWWFPQVVVALLVGVSVLSAQEIIDYFRAERDHQIAAQQDTQDRDIAADQAKHAERLENLRFVRQRALGDPTIEKFAGLDLRDQDLASLNLTGADFEHAILINADLFGATLVQAATYLEGEVSRRKRQLRPTSPARP